MPITYNKTDNNIITSQHNIYFTDNTKLTKVKAWVICAYKHFLIKIITPAYP